MMQMMIRSVIPLIQLMPIILDAITVEKGLDIEDNDPICVPRKIMPSGTIRS